jgi:DNA-binding SARP family transcriptional activator
MDTPRVSLFGTFQIRHGSQSVPGFEACRVQELFCYLLLNRDRPLSREKVASVLWGECTTTQSRAYLRKALWQLQSALLGRLEVAGMGLLRVENDWIQLNSGCSFWLDIAVFEGAFARVHGVPGEDLDPGAAAALREAVDLYHGDLLHNWYQEWCLHERDRLQNIQLVMLEKLMASAAANRDYEIATEYGERILRFDRAHEQTHRELMRLRNLVGDRTGALRQYERCVASLRDELGVEPAERTVALYQEIRVGSSDPESISVARASVEQQPVGSSLHGILGRLQQLQTILVDVQRQVAREIKVVESALDHQRTVCSD